MHAPPTPVRHAKNWESLYHKQFGNDTMGWQIMGTEHLGERPSGKGQLSPDEIADATIDFMESIGPALLPWQATTLLAMLAYPVGTRFVVSAPPQHSRYVMAPPMDVVRKQIQDDLERFASRSGFKSDSVILDELRQFTEDLPRMIAEHMDSPVEDVPPLPGMVKVQRDGAWVWEYPCTCAAADDSCRVHG